MNGSFHHAEQRCTTASAHSNVGTGVIGGKIRYAIRFQHEHRLWPALDISAGLIWPGFVRVPPRGAKSLHGAICGVVATELLPVFTGFGANCYRVRAGGKRSIGLTH